MRRDLVRDEPGTLDRRAPAGSRRAAPPCRPGRRARSSQRPPSGPTSGAAASASATAWLPSSCTPARPSRTMRGRRGRRRRWASRTADGDQRAGRARGPPGTSAAVASPGSSDQGDRGPRRCRRRAGRASSASRRGRRAASASRKRPRRSSPGARCTTREVVDRSLARGRARPASTQPARSCSPTRRSTALANPAAPAGRRPRGRRRRSPTPRRARARASPSSWCAPRRSTSSTGGSTSRQRPVDAGGDHRVVACPARAACRRSSSVAKPASRPCRPGLAQQPGQHQVGVGVLVVDGAQHLEGDPPGRVGLTRGRRCGSSAGPRRAGPRAGRGSRERTRPARGAAPRAQSAAGMSRLPCGWTSPSRPASVPSRPGRRRSARRAARRLPGTVPTVGRRPAGPGRA